MIDQADVRVLDHRNSLIIDLYGVTADGVTTFRAPITYRAVQKLRDSLNAALAVYEDRLEEENERRAAAAGRTP